MSARRHRAYTRTSNPLFNAPAAERKKILERERRLRRNGDWGEWEKLPNPNYGIGRGWLAEVQQVRKNRVFAVLVRDVGTAIHLAVASLSGDRPSWHEMQRIKNEIAGPDVTAVEVYPPQSEVVDDADMYHLWLVGPLSFSLQYEAP